MEIVIIHFIMLLCAVVLCRLVYVTCSRKMMSLIPPAIPALSNQTHCPACVFVCVST